MIIQNLHPISPNFMNEREKGHWTTCIWFKSWIIDSKLKMFEYLNWRFRIWTGCRSFSDLSNSLNWNNAGNKNLGLEENTLFLYLSVFASKIIIIRISAHFILLHKTYWVDSTWVVQTGQVRLKACTVHVLPARIMQFLVDWGCFYQTNNQ